MSVFKKSYLPITESIDLVVNHLYNYTNDYLYNKGGCEMAKNIEKTTNDIEEKRTTLSLSLTVSDKKALKMIALEKDTTIASIIHEWIAEYLEGDK